MRRLHAAMSLVAILTVAPVVSAQVHHSHRADIRLRPSPDVPDQATALQAVGSCDDLRGYLTDVSVEQLVRWLYLDWAVPWSQPGGDGDVGPTSATETNVQEAGVDEIDTVKTDGLRLFYAQDHELHVVRSWPADATAEVDRITVDGWTNGLFLYHDLVLLASTFWDPAGGFPYGGTRIDLIDVSDAARSRIVRSIEAEGWLVDARRIGADVYLVMHSYIPVPDAVGQLIAYPDDLGLPRLPPDASWEDRLAAAATARGILTPLVADIYAGIEVAELLPILRDLGGQPTTTPLVACGDLFRPTDAAETALLTVLHLDLDDAAVPGGTPSSAGILASGWTIYASPDTLYAAAPGWTRWWGWGTPDTTTRIHAFDLTPAAAKPVRYVATGVVPGYMVNQFAMSEFNGDLRVATTDGSLWWGGWWWDGGGGDGPEPPANNVFVLAREGDALTAIGELRGLAPDERIYGVRFAAERGYLVTFRQVDPLFTLDLSDPTAPSVVGELAVTGYSSYLHPVPNDRLLTVGMEADDQGRVLGLAVSLFDVSDPALPSLDDRYVVDGGGWSWSDALADHHAFTYSNGVLAIPAWIQQSGQSSFNGLLVLDASVANGIVPRGTVDHSDLSTRPWDGHVTRSVFIDDMLYSLSSAGLKVNNLEHPSRELARIVW